MYQQQASFQQPAAFRPLGQQQSSVIGTPVASQYRGMQRTYQPTGYVQSAYQGLNNQQPQQQLSQQGQFQTQGQIQNPVNPQAYHTANYRGSQPGHDQYLRADSVNPSQQLQGFGQVQQGAASAFGQQPQTQFQQQPQQFPTSTQQQAGQTFRPQSQIGQVGQIGQIGQIGGQQAFQNQFPTSTQQQGTQAFGQQSQQGQYGSISNPVNPQAYHTANYRGSQPGHDQYLRADSVNPSQQLQGIGQQAQGFAQPQIQQQGGLQGQFGQQAFLSPDSTNQSTQLGGIQSRF